jgi:hypothetical protein
VLAAALGGSPEWWMEQDDTMVATGVQLVDELRGH